MDTSSAVLSHETVDQPKVTRMINIFSPCIWGDFFLNFKLDIELWEKYSAEDNELKEQVRMLFHEERKPSAKIVLIDTLERLGVAYHFEGEIENILQELFESFEYNEDYDLYYAALHFRIFRQHGYNISCDVFNKFKGSDGKLKESLTSDAPGMLSLYEAANLAKRGDDILDEALIFTRTRLETMIPTLSSDFAEQVTRSLNLCLHKSLPRIETRNYIDKYEEDPLRNETLLRFAKIDYNLLQLLHLQECSNVSKWWKDFASNFPYARDRIVECYLWSIGVYFEPHYTVSRITITKLVALTSLLDDTFDSYGTLDELKLFTDAIERWDATAIQILPDYLKLIYKIVLDLFEEFDQQFTTDGRSNAVNIVKLETQNLVRSYYNEAKWVMGGGKILFDDYIANALVTSTYLLAAPGSFLGMREATADEEEFIWQRNEPKVTLAIAAIGRYSDDIVTYEIEKARGQEETGIEWYMHQYGVSKEDAIKVFKHRVEEAWKDLNEERLKPTSISKKFLERLINLARVIEVVYGKSDSYTNPEELKDLITSLLKTPIPLA